MEANRVVSAVENDVTNDVTTSSPRLASTLSTLVESSTADEGGQVEGQGRSGDSGAVGVDSDPGSLRSTTSVSFGRSVHIEHSHKLEKKQSSGDLHSRLKTRKLLGVGETPDGDVHRSKLSQILGHNDQLYTKLPRGLRVWQYVNGVVISLLAFVAILLPSYATPLIPHLAVERQSVAVDGSVDAESPVVFVSSDGSTAGTLSGDAGTPQGDDGATLATATRLQGAALAGLAVLLWNSLRQTDRELIRCVALASTVFWSLHVAVLALSLLESGQFLAGSVRHLTPRLVAAGVSFYYCRALCRPTRPKTPAVSATNMSSGGGGGGLMTTTANNNGSTPPPIADKKLV